MYPKAHHPIPLTNAKALKLLLAIPTIFHWCLTVYCLCYPFVQHVQDETEKLNSKPLDTESKPLPSLQLKGNR